MFKILCILFPSGLLAVESLSFQEFDQFSKYLQQEVEVRGFLYKIDEHFILAAEPNLKSCCVGNVNKSPKQVIVHGLPGDHIPSSLTVLLKGQLVETVPKTYQLENASIEVDVDHSLSLWIFLIFLIGVFLSFQIGKRKK